MAKKAEKKIHYGTCKKCKKRVPCAIHWLPETCGFLFLFSFIFKQEWLIYTFWLVPVGFISYFIYGYRCQYCGSRVSQVK
ncbi:MAG: hypothetical protein IJ846_02690 [Alphaproteobacteria bacterium]|nr:hypothetical protein [Alphaproteobacteria bacterium]